MPYFLDMSVRWYGLTLFCWWSSSSLRVLYDTSPLECMFSFEYLATLESPGKQALAGIPILVGTCSVHDRMTHDDNRSPCTRLSSPCPRFHLLPAFPTSISSGVFMRSVLGSRSEFFFSFSAYSSLLLCTCSSCPGALFVLIQAQVSPGLKCNALALTLTGPFQPLQIPDPLSRALQSH